MEMVLRVHAVLQAVGDDSSNITDFPESALKRT
jgi:hypothetical protein